jgi:signal transduction histidine kinase/DNA-binding response OmpR family regulator
MRSDLGNQPPEETRAVAPVVSDRSEMATIIQSHDWATTPLGPPEDWSPTLRLTVNILLANRFPLLLWWGPDYVSIYNDAYRPILGAKHPSAIGLPCKECWSEIWHVLKPLIDSPFNGGPSTWIEDLALELKRHDFTEEAHFTVAYSPVPDDSAANGIGGVLATVHEITEKIVGERRIGALRDLATPAEAKTAEEACTIAASALSAHTKDIPFALIYLIDPIDHCARLAGATGVAIGADVAPSVIALGESTVTARWPLYEVLQTEGSVVIDSLAGRFSDVPAVSPSEPPHTAMVIPIKSSVAHELSGFFIAAASPRLKFDEQYKSFLELAATQIAAAISTARAYEAERKRAEALAEIDRAKTLFFSNVSHEFRTPLTLMLGPLEDALASFDLPPSEREKLDTAHRNSLRLLKLVNSLLDFSRIEAGRAQANYEPVDLAALTADLASNYRSACERVGLKLVVDCTPPAEPAFVDRDMWEKIVLNLLSNAFKFTFDGEITVRLRQIDGHAELSISDSGVGIPPHEIPRLFERFHRIEGQRSRTYEGSGIGLALVQELIKLHKGTIGADSIVDRGTTFTVTVPLGMSHLPPHQIVAPRPAASTAVHAQAYVEEALRWSSDDMTAAGSVLGGANNVEARRPQIDSARILLADDNADMRAYVRGLLGPHCDVQTVADGQDAIEAIRQRPPDLVLADVMMPRLDGLGLVQVIRDDASIANLPVILLSARAGEEAKVQGLEAGADDYLVKPFNGRELIARVRVNLNLAELRKSTAADLRDMRRLRQVAEQCARTGDQTQECLDEILDAAIAITEADKGDIQLFDSGRGGMKLAAQRGFEPPSAQFFEHARADDASASGRALRTFDRVIVEDVTRSQIFTASDATSAILRAGVRALQATPLVSSEGAVLGVISTYFAEPHNFSPQRLRVLDVLARQAGDYLERKEAEASLRRQSAWSAGQKEAFQAAINGAPLEESLGILTKTAVMQMGEGGRCAFYIADAAGTALHHIVGMPEAYANSVDGFKIGSDSFSCGLAVHRGEPVITADVTEDPRWREWRWLAAEHGCRAVWSFPVETSAGKVVGSFAMYFPKPRQPAARDLEFAAALTQAAGIIISRQQEAQERVRAEDTRRLLLQELNHRVKNTLASVQAIAQQTVRSTKDPDDFAARFSGRIQSLARVHSLLTDSTWRGADLRQLIRDQLLRGSVDQTRLTARGPAVHLQPQAAVHMAVMLHELGTNSVKYGSLSVPKGSVTIDWSVAGDALSLQWVERGGPVVSVPARRGFGTTLIEQSARSEGGRAEQLFEPEGITWKITVALPNSATSPEPELRPEPLPPKPEPIAPAKPAARLAGLRLLVVEDESLIALDLMDRLEMAGGDVAPAVSTEKDALAAVEQGGFDCALLDANLHGRSVQNIAAALTRRGIPFVFITGYGRAGLPPSFQHAPTLSKPVSDQDLFDAITKIVSPPNKVLRLKQ